jgi:hypothetical protein
MQKLRTVGKVLTYGTAIYFSKYFLKGALSVARDISTNQFPLQTLEYAMKKYQVPPEMAYQAAQVLAKKALGAAVAMVPMSLLAGCIVGYILFPEDWRLAKNFFVHKVINPIREGFSRRNADYADVTYPDVNITCPGILNFQ